MDIREACKRTYFGVVCNGGKRSKSSITTVVVHQTQGPTAESAARYLHTRADGSVHKIVDTYEQYRDAPDNLICCGVAGFNGPALHIEMAGYSTMAWWFPFNRKRRRMLRRCAWQVAKWLYSHNLPNRYVSTKALRHGERRGWTTHEALTDANDAIGVTSTHQDPWPFRKKHVPQRYLKRYIGIYLTELRDAG